MHFVPREPPFFPDDLEPDAFGLVALGGGLSEETLLEAYGKGLFPWSGEDPVPWFSPDPRMVLLPRELRVSDSLRQTIGSGRYEVAFDRDFEATIRACASVARRHDDGTWINGEVIEAYGALHRRGIAHSVEAYRDGELCGGLYGLSLGRAFFGESMFAVGRDASKVALQALCARLVEWDFLVVDCQQVTGHLMRLGALAIPREEYLDLLAGALRAPSRLGSWS